VACLLEWLYPGLTLHIDKVLNRHCCLIFENDAFLTPTRLFWNRGLEMTLFALCPLNSELHDRRWLNSRSSEAQFVEAIGEQQARNVAAGALTLPLLREPSPGSPWLQPRLVEVIPVSGHDSRDNPTAS
jgi:hypothetical protein